MKYNLPHSQYVSMIIISLYSILLSVFQLISWFAIMQSNQKQQIRDFIPQMRGSLSSNKGIISPHQSIQSQNSQSPNKMQSLSQIKPMVNLKSKTIESLVNIDQTATQNKQNLKEYHCPSIKSLNQMVFQKQLQSSLTTIKEQQFQQPNQEQIKQTIIKSIQSDIKNTVKKGISILQSKSEKIINQSQNGIIQEGYLALVEEKLKQHLNKTQIYIQKIVQELKYMIYGNFMDKKKLEIDFLVPQKGEHQYQQISSSKSQRRQKIKQLSEQKQLQQKDNTSRVSYLKQKLIQFQKINKKYQKMSQPKQINLNQNISKKVVEKMNHIKNYLQESQSSIQQSNLQQSLFNESSLDKWRKIDQFPKKNSTT